MYFSISKNNLLAVLPATALGLDLPNLQHHKSVAVLYK